MYSVLLKRNISSALRTDQMAHYSSSFLTLRDVEEGRREDSRTEEAKEHTRGDEVVCQLALILTRQPLSDGMEHLSKLAEEKRIYND